MLSNSSHQLRHESLTLGLLMVRSTVEAPELCRITGLQYQKMAE